MQPKRTRICDPHFVKISLEFKIQFVFLKVCDVVKMLSMIYMRVSEQIFLQISSQRAGSLQRNFDGSKLYSKQDTLSPV